MQRPAILAHRGGAGEAPENTLAALAHAVACGAEGVELDIRLTLDGVAVVFHDDDLERLAGSARRVDATPLAELEALALELPHALAGQARVPTLAAALAAAAPLALINLELKTAGDADRLAARTLEALAASGRSAGAIVTSLDPAAVDAVRRRRPDLPCGPVIAAGGEATLAAERGLVSLELGLALAGGLAAARARGLTALVWTVDDAAGLAALAGAGAAAVITDFPARLLRARAAT